MACPKYYSQPHNGMYTTMGGAKGAKDYLTTKVGTGTAMGKIQNYTCKLAGGVVYKLYAD